MAELVDLKIPRIVAGPPGPRVRKILGKAGLDPDSYGSPIVDEARGIWIKDPDGNIFLDFISSRCVVNVGHNHPRIVEALHRQLDRSIHWLSEAQFQLTEKLVEITPGSYGKQIFYTQSGSMAVEFGIKTARRATGRPNIISFAGAYHGTAYGALSISGYDPVMKKSYGPTLPGVYHMPYPCCSRCPFGLEHPDCDLACLHYIKDYAFKSYLSADEVAAIFVEPVLGDAGWYVPPPGWLRGLKEICEQHGILLVVDEIQTGFGRTGRWFGLNHSGVEPDIILVGKSLASGVPLSACVLREDLIPVTDAEPIPIHAQSFSGTPLGCASALATIDTIKKEGLVENAAIMGAYMKKRLLEMMDDHTIIGDVRGIGLLIGVEVVKDRKTKSPGVEEADKICARAFDKGLYVLNMGSFGTRSLRVAPPLIIDAEQADNALELLEASISEVESEL